MKNNDQTDLRPCRCYRATFYNHFEDKYAALDYIADVLLHEEQKPAAHSGDILRVILSLSETMYEHRVFLLHAFQVQGQNDFDHMFVKHLGELIEEVLLIMRHDARKASLYSNEALARYFANAFMFLCKQWLREGCRYTPQEFAAYSNGLLMNGLKDFFGKNKCIETIRGDGMTYRIGFDIGSTTIKAVVMNENGDILYQEL